MRLSFTWQKNHFENNSFWNLKCIIIIHLLYTSSASSRQSSCICLLLEALKIIDLGWGGPKPETRIVCQIHWQRGGASRWQRWAGVVSSSVTLETAPRAGQHARMEAGFHVRAVLTAADVGSLNGWDGLAHLLVASPEPLPTRRVSQGEDLPKVVVPRTRRPLALPPFILWLFLTEQL